jgi:hypothetical protein
MSNPYPGYGQQPPQGYGGYGQAPGQPPYPGHMPTGQAAPLPPGAASSGRRGTSRALPIMVAAGLAVGVCGGLVLVLGTGESDAASKPEVKGEGGKGSDTGTPGEEQVAVLPPDAAVPPPPPDAAPEPRTRKVTIRFDVEPPEAEVTVDSEAITDGTFAIELEREESRTVALEAKASGYKPFKGKHTITGNDVVPIKLEKRASRTSGTRRTNDSRSGDSGGRIDF